LRFQGVCYRAHDPRWAWAPISGEGAAIHGGRFNPKGVPALYLASTVEGMYAEMGHGFVRRFEPLTVCSYDLDIEDMADLRTPSARDEAGVALTDMTSPWLLDIADGRRPKSWDVAQRLIDEGVAGALVPSFAIGARPDQFNAVLWKWSAEPPHRVTVFDPSGRLPMDQSSWKTDSSPQF
jgi:RES domain-containing protein